MFLVLKPILFETGTTTPTSIAAACIAGSGWKTGASASSVHSSGTQPSQQVAGDMMREAGVLLLPR